jgi:NADP-dependent 3-hydroxy acid dehydrogenase YdfG
VHNLVAAALDRHQRIDGLVNNAGASLHGPLDQVDPAEFGRIFQLNVASMLTVTQAVLPAMREQGFGRIVNITGRHRYRGVAATALDHRDRVRRRQVHPWRHAAAGNGGA